MHRTVDRCVDADAWRAARIRAGNELIPERDGMATVPPRCR
jgi:hypothetical protein